MGWQPAPFIFSTVAITFLGETIPQAYFARHALRMVGKLRPVLDFYRVLLFPVAKPTAMVLNRRLGHEGMMLFRERDFRALLIKHVEADGNDVDRLEALGALNFLDLDAGSHP